MEKLNSDKIREKLEGFPGWELKGEDITKEFKFCEYITGLDFAHKLGEKSELIDHHSEMVIGYKKVRINTHTDSANGITELDFRLAEHAEKIYSEMK